MLYLSDILELAQSSTFDEGVFQVYQDLGRLMVANANSARISHRSTNKLAHELQIKLNDFNASWQLSSGLSMEALWTLFRPSVAENAQQLETCLQTEELADRFDALSWVSGASYQEIWNLSQSIADMYNRIKPTDIRLDEHLEVSNHTLTAYGITHQFQDARNAIRDLESLSTGHRANKDTYLCDQFEGLRQYAAAASNNGPTESHAILDLFAGRSIKDSLQLGYSSNAYSILHDVANSTGISDSDRALVPLRYTLPASTLHRMLVPSQSLRVSRA